MEERRALNQPYDYIENQADHQDRGPDHRLSRELWEWLKAILFAVAIALVIRLVLFTPIVVDGESMFPTLHDGERLIVNKVVYLLKEPERGEIVVFHATQGKDWIKRVIGEPGDTVEVIDGKLYINDELFNEPYLELDNGYVMEDFKVEVPANELFVMGDNRANSRDSRNIGTIPIDSVVGRAELVFWPIGDIRLVD
jgi:signal peptidase I